MPSDEGCVRSVAWAAMGLSTLTVAVCLIAVPMLSDRLASWQVDVKRQMDSFRALTDDSWQQMMHVRAASPQLAEQRRRQARQAPEVQVVSKIRTDSQGEWIFIPHRRGGGGLQRNARSRGGADYAGGDARPQQTSPTRGGGGGAAYNGDGGGRDNGGGGEQYSGGRDNGNGAGQYNGGGRDNGGGGGGTDAGYRGPAVIAVDPIPRRPDNYGPATSAPDAGSYGGDKDQGDACADSRGPPGSPGQPGRDGEAGANGEDGQPGLPGPNIKPDVVEWPCITCPQGLPGSSGPRGPTGGGGKKGLPGQGGIPGRPGANGFMGAKGPSGNPGDRGKGGRRGLPGLDTLGGKGQPGSKGAPGPRGPHGSRGTPGRKIAYGGGPGPQGIRGVNGQPGVPGNPGRDGRPGDSGTPGKDGEYCPCPPKSALPGYPSAPDGLVYEEQGGGNGGQDQSYPGGDAWGPANPPAAVDPYAQQQQNGQYNDRPSVSDTRDGAYLSPWQKQ